MTEDSGFWHYAASHPDKIALVSSGGSQTTYGALFARVNQLSHLIRSLDVHPGEHLAFMLPNIPDVFTIGLACAQIGVLFTPINHHLLTEEVAYVIEDSEARIFVTDERFAAVAVSAADAARLRSEGRLAIGAVPGFSDLDVALAGQPTTLPEDRSAGAPFVYTSGTTGKPKGILRKSSLGSLDRLLHAAKEGLAKYGWTDADTYLSQGPLYHSGVLGHPLNILQGGGTVVIMEDKWTPERCLQLIDEYRVRGTHMVPTMFSRLLNLPDDVKAKYDLSCLQDNATVQSAAMCPVDVKQAMLEWWGPVFSEVYGGTEGSLTRITSQDWLAHPGSVGRANPGVTLKILDEDGNECPPGVIGTIYGRMDGAEGFGSEYFKAPEKTAAARVHGFQTLGDMGYLDEDGWLFVADRRVDLIVSGGVNIYPAEIESVLLRHPAVVDAAVFGIPHPDWGQEVKAVVEPVSLDDTGPELEAELIAFCQQHLAKYKSPRSVDFRAELPRYPSGKLYKRRLREEYLAASTGSSNKDS